MKSKPDNTYQDCDTCEHETMCRKNIWDVWFEPPCFVGADDDLNKLPIDNQE